MDKHISKRLKKIMSIIFSTPIENIDDNASDETIEGWDSIAHINLTVALEEEFGIQFEVSDIPELITYKEILAKIKDLESKK
tara:strand:- start:4368 stop:4613 length:246 start_codon:yes stop_codon:yes gene_type:complete